MYYVPDFEDIFFGYECEIRTRLPRGLMAQMNGDPVQFTESWHPARVGISHMRTYDGTFQMEDLQRMWEEENIPNPKLYEVESYIENKALRTKYLTSEQIQLEGWVYLPGQQTRAGEKVFIRHPYLLRFNNRDRTVRITKRSEGDSLFYGVFPSINELRKVCKLIGTTTKETTQST